MAILSFSLVKKKVEEALDRALPSLPPEVVRIRFSLGEDWLGNPALYFKVILIDSASERSMLLNVVDRVRDEVLRELPEDLGFEAYFNFRTESEQAEMKEPAWQ